MVRLARAVGFDPVRFAHALPSILAFYMQFRRYRHENTNRHFQAALGDVYPILHEANESAGSTGHYFHQDLWAARKIFERRPLSHLDVGSRIDGLISHLLVFMSVTAVDIRPMRQKVSGLNFVCDDATYLGTFGDNSAESISSLHAAEHFGLGRYGDQIDANACFRFMDALQRVLAPGGRLYFSVPIGRERVEFNAHRVFSADTILRHFERLGLVSFSFIGDDGETVLNACPADIPAADVGCGLFEFTKA